MIFADVLLPVFLVGAVGFLLGRIFRLTTKPLTKLVFYIFGPALVFQSLTTNALSGVDVWRTILFVVALETALLTLGAIGPLVLRWDEQKRAAALLAFSFSNVGTYGLPVLLFAFGREGFALGVLYMLVHSAVQATVGVGIASWRKGMSASTLLSGVLRVRATAPSQGVPVVPEGTRSRAPRESAVAWFDRDGAVETKVFHRDDLRPDASLADPAIILGEDATTLLPPGTVGRVDPFGSLILEIR